MKRTLAEKAKRHDRWRRGLPQTKRDGWLDAGLVAPTDARNSRGYSLAVSYFARHTLAGAIAREGIKEVKGASRCRKLGVEALADKLAKHTRKNAGYGKKSIDRIMDTTLRSHDETQYSDDTPIVAKTVLVPDPRFGKHGQVGTVGRPQEMMMKKEVVRVRWHHTTSADQLVDATLDWECRPNGRTYTEALKLGYGEMTDGGTVVTKPMRGAIKSLTQTKALEREEKRLTGIRNRSLHLVADEILKTQKVFRSPAGRSRKPKGKKK